MQRAQHINTNSNVNIRVICDCPNIASRSLQLHQLAPLHESIHHAQGHSLAIKLGTAENCPCSCALVGPPIQSDPDLLLG